MEQNLVFHISDVTTTDSSDAASAAPVGKGVSRYKREQLQVMSRNNERASSHAGGQQQSGESLESVHEEHIITTTAYVTGYDKRASVSSSMQGTINPGYVENECDIQEGDESRPDYLRSQSDGGVDYRDESDEEWGSSWDSDSETWSNLYDYSDIDEILLDDGDGCGTPHKLSPNIAAARRRASRASGTGSRGHRRKLSSQVSLPLDGQSPHQRERRKSEDRRRKKRSKRKGRRGSRDLVSGLESTMGLKVASNLMPHEPHADQQDHVVDEGAQPFSPSTDGGSGIPPPPPLPNLNSLPRSREVQETSIHSDEDNEQRSEFAYALAAAAGKLKRSKHTEPVDKVVQRQPNIVRRESGAIVSRNVSRKASVAKTANIAILPDMPQIANIAPQKSTSRKESLKTQIRRARKLRRGSSSSLDTSTRPSPVKHEGVDVDVHRAGSQLNHKNSSADKKVPLLRKHSSGKSQSRVSAPPAPTHQHLEVPGSAVRPVSAPELDPTIANMTLSKILTNPFLKDMLRQSLESLDSLDELESTKDGSSAAKNDKHEERAPSPNPFAGVSVVENSPEAPPRTKKVSRKPSDELGQVSSSTHDTKPPSARRMSLYGNPSEMKYYEIPNIDSDHRFRPRKPIRRGIHAFKAAAQAVTVQNFLKKAMTRPAAPPKPTVDRTNSRTSWSTEYDTDLV